ncbi:MAG: tRNA pseudouridine(38-40) synthase TruA [Micrococcales bacterium]
MNESVDREVDGLIRLSQTRFRLGFSYDGTDFFGWAKQPGLRTVQGELLSALTVIFGEDQDDFGIRVAGRTDAGVHALNQQAHIELTEEQQDRLGRNRPDIDNPKFLADRLNRILSDDLRVHTVAKAAPGFDARFSAIFRRYRYRIADGLAGQNPLESRFTLNVFQNLDTLAMQAASLEVLGLHDFASFCRPRPGSTTIRELREVTVTRNVAAGNIIEIELMADAFCHNMVRSIVGALIAVGKGQATSADIRATLERASRTESYRVVAAKGLTLIEIGYPADELLAAQAELAKNLRSHEELEG